MQKEYPITQIDALQDNESLEFCLYKDARPYYGFLVKKSDGVYAYANSCPHQGRMLQWMPNTFLTKDKEKIMCGAHGATFAIETGLCDAGPCLGASLQPLVVKIENKIIFITHPDE